MSVSRKAGGSSAHDQYDRIEVVHANRELSVPASDLNGSTGQTFGQSATWEGLELFPLDEVLDRRDVGEILHAKYELETYITSTQTADGTVRTNVEVSSSPSLEQASTHGNNGGDVADTGGDFAVESSVRRMTDSQDLLGPTLTAVGFGPITDGTNGVGGAGTSGEQSFEVDQDEIGDPVFDARDEVYLNGAMEHSNVSDAALHADFQAVWVIGVKEQARA